MFGLGLRHLKRVYHDRFEPTYPNPIKKPAEFAEFVQRWVREFRPDMVIPVNSDEITALFPYREELERYTVFPFGDRQMYETLRDKWSCYQLLGKYMPRTGLFENGIYLKPTDKTSGKGVVKVVKKGRFVAQEAFDGVGVGFEALVQNGEVIYSFIHRRIREYPIKGGSSTARHSWYHEGIYRTAHEIVAETGWTGFIMIEFRYNDETDDYTLIEINPRPWGSVQLAIDSGVRFPSLAYDLFVDGLRHNDPGLQRWQSERIETRLVPADMMAGFQHLLRGEVSEFIDSISLGKDFHRECFTFREPMVLLLAMYSGFKRPFAKLLGRY
jgi:hypothetical protein